MPIRIHAGVFRAFQTQRASEPADLSSSAPSKEAVDLGTVRAPQSREAGKPGHELRSAELIVVFTGIQSGAPRWGRGFPSLALPLGRVSLTRDSPVGPQILFLPN